jgi:hypothetical protein
VLNGPRKTNYTGHMVRLGRSLFLLSAGWALLALAGCRSPYVQTTVVNSGTTELHNVEVDYPSASFGMSSLAPGAAFHYRFQIQDAGRVKVEYSDSSQHSYASTGPYVAEGQQGTLVITLDDKGKSKWQASLQPAVPTPKDE